MLKHSPIPMALPGLSLLFCAALSGCHARTDAPNPAQSAAIASPAPQTAAESKEQRAELIKTLSAMTPEERNAYVKTHPEALRSFTK